MEEKEGGIVRDWYYWTEEGGGGERGRERGKEADFEKENGMEDVKYREVFHRLMRIDVDESFSLPFAHLDFLAAGLLVSGALRCLFEDLPYSPYQLPSDFLLNLFASKSTLIITLPLFRFSIIGLSL